MAAGHVSVLTQEPVAPTEQPSPPEALAVRSEPALSRGARETFLLTARIVSSRSAPKGITDSRRVTLSDGVLTHDAHVQSIDEARASFQGKRGTELNFRDSWRYNVAAYRLNLLLGLDMVPVTVQRSYQYGPASFTWWVDDVMMDEGTRLTEKRRAPDLQAWNRQMAVDRRRRLAPRGNRAVLQGDAGGAVRPASARRRRALTHRRDREARRVRYGGGAAICGSGKRPALAMSGSSGEGDGSRAAAALR